MLSEWRVQGKRQTKGKTIFVAVADDQVDVARKAITDVTGDLSQPNAGVLFGVPISFAEGVN